MLLYSGGFVEEGFLKVNVDVFSVLILCFDNPRCFFYINNESAEKVCSSGSLATKMACGKDFRMRKVICTSFGLGESVLISRLVISFISL
jgi:hypothetical protein